MTNDQKVILNKIGRLRLAKTCLQEREYQAAIDAYTLAF
jgi:hypothetical protein